MDWWLLIVAVATLAATIAAVWAARRYGYRRGHIILDVRSIRLLPFEYEANGKVESPPMHPAVQFGIQVRMRNQSRSDIASEDFKGKPIVFNVGLDFVVHSTIIEGGFGAPLLEPSQGERAKVFLEPMRIPRGAKWRWLLHVYAPEQAADVAPYFSVASPIHDARVKVTVHKAKSAPAYIAVGLGEPYGFRGGGTLGRRRVDYY